MKKALVVAFMILAVCSLAAPAHSANLLYSLPTFSASGTGLTSAITGTTGAEVTSGPTLTISQAGTYSLSSMVTTTLNGSTLAEPESVSCWLYRTNNTPGAIAYGTGIVTLPTMTTQSIVGPAIAIAPISYTTANTNDAIKIYCSITADPGAGEVDVTSIYMLAMRYK